MELGLAGGTSDDPRAPVGDRGSRALPGAPANGNDRRGRASRAPKTGRRAPDRAAPLADPDGPPVSRNRAAHYLSEVVAAGATDHRTHDDLEAGGPAARTAIERGRPLPVFLLAVGADEDLLTLPDPNGPGRSAFHRIRLNAATPIARHGPFLHRVCLRPRYREPPDTLGGGVRPGRCSAPAGLSARRASRCSCRPRTRPRAGAPSCAPLPLDGGRPAGSQGEKREPL